MRYPPLQGPLLWQQYLLFWLCGIAAALWPWPALTAAALIICFFPSLRHIPRLALALALMAAACALTLWQLTPPAPENLPVWYRDLPQERLPSARVPRICGQVLEVHGLPDARLRLILENVRPAAPQAGAPVPALPQRVVWTWDTPLFRPVAGQHICVSRQLLPVRGPANSGLADWEAYWKVRNVQWRLWSMGHKGDPVLYGRADSMALWREVWRTRFLTALTAPALPASAMTSPTEAEPRAMPAQTGPQGLAHQASPSSPAVYANGLLADLPQSKAIVLALLFGDRSGLSHETTELFAQAALAHSLALSGQHLAIAGLLAVACVFLAGRLWPSLYLYCPRALLVLVTSLPLALAYLWLGNAPASLLRAAVMLCFVALWLWQKRTASTWDVLCAALACITVVDPLSALDTGLQLSALCVGIIALSLPWLRRILPAAHALKAEHSPQRGRTCLRSLLSIFSISLLIQAGLLPLNILLFGNAGFWFVLNILWLPLVSLVVLPAAVFGLFCALVHWQTVAAFSLWLASLPCEALLGLLHWLKQSGWLDSPLFLRPHWTALLAFASLFIAWAMLAGPLSRRRSKTCRLLLVTGLALLCVGPLLRTLERFSERISVDIMDVGQGLAVALRLPGHVRVLVDGGGSASPRFDTGEAVVAPHLTYNDAPRLTALCNSHPDLDHVGGLIHIGKTFQTSYLRHNGEFPRGKLTEPWAALCTAQQACPLYAGDVLLPADAASGLRLEVLHPPRPARAQAGPAQDRPFSGNDASLVIRLTRHGHGLFLFTGDAERKALKHILSSGQNVQADVVLAPHHGAAGGFLKEFYEATKAQLAVASCGQMNRFRHPSAKVRQGLAALGIPLVTTAAEGGIQLHWEDKGPVRVETTRP